MLRQYFNFYSCSQNTVNNENIEELDCETPIGSQCNKMFFIFFIGDQHSCKSLCECVAIENVSKNVKSLSWQGNNVCNAYENRNVQQKVILYFVCWKKKNKELRVRVIIEIMFYF